MVTHDEEMSSDPNWYIYVHRDSSGQAFYVGRGQNRRAWEKNGRARHEFWQHYVQNHLGGEYSVEILEDGLNESDSYSREIHWMGTFDPDQLVNWSNYHASYSGDGTKYGEALHTHYAVKELVDEIREVENEHPEVAIKQYQKLLGIVADYAPIIHSYHRTGLVRRMQIELHGEELMKGEIVVLDRLTLCLKKVRRLDEAKAIVIEYFQKYPGDLTYKAAGIIQKRVKLA